MMEISLHRQKIFATIITMIFVLQVSMVAVVSRVEAWTPGQTIDPESSFIEPVFYIISELCGNEHNTVTDVFKELQETSQNDPVTQLAENTPTKESMIQELAQKLSSRSGQKAEEIIAEAKRIIDRKMTTQVGANDKEGSVSNTVGSTIDADEITDIGETTITDTTYQTVKNTISRTEENQQRSKITTALSSFADYCISNISTTWEVATETASTIATSVVGALSGIPFCAVAYAETPNRREDDEIMEDYKTVNQKFERAISSTKNSQTDNEYAKMTQEEQKRAEQITGKCDTPVPQAIINPANNHNYETIYKTTFSEAIKYGAQIVFPADGIITSSWGDRIHPIFGTVKHHAGVDISLEEGTPLGAARDGKVTYAGWMQGYGWTIEIDHGNGLSTLYGHNSALNVKVGDYVRAGDIVAYAGSTGYSTGTHCHFGVYVNGQDVDPFSLLGNYKQFIKNK